MKTKSGDARIMKSAIESVIKQTLAPEDIWLKENPEKKYTYDWIWYVLMTLYAGFEAYWLGKAIEHAYPPSVTIPMGLMCMLVSCGYLIAFVNSKKQIQEKKDED
jgi:hypothetical protein